MEKKNYAKIALGRLVSRVQGFACAVCNVSRDDMADKETRAFWKGARYVSDALVRACYDADDWVRASEEHDSEESGDAEVDCND